MKLNKIISSGMKNFKEEFTKNCENFDFSELTPGLFDQFTNCLKNAVAILGQSMIKDFVCEYEVNEDYIVKNNKVYRFKLDSEKTFLTYFGEITLNRNIFQNDRGGLCHVPLDSKWGVENEYATADVQEAILYSSAHMIPNEVMHLFKKCALFNPSTTAVQNIIKESNQVFENNEDTIYAKIQEQEDIPNKTEVMVGSIDGANVLLREKGKRKGAKPKRPIDFKKEDNEKTCYKNAMAGTISFYETRKKEEKHPNRLETRCIACMPEDNAVTFKEKFENMVKDTVDNMSDEIKKLLLLDGARGLWNYALNTELFDDFEKLIDFYHTTEHLSKAAEIIFGENKDKSSHWYGKYREALLTDKNAPMSIIRSIEYYMDSQIKGKSRKKQLQTELTFFKNNSNKMEYVRFLKKGWPIGSGPVEAACKSIIKTRLCRSGMRWLRKGGQAILNLRAIVKSNRWELFWPIYQEAKLCA